VASFGGAKGLAELGSFWSEILRKQGCKVLKNMDFLFQKISFKGGAFDSAKNHNRQSVTAKREKSQTPKFV